jgi:crotonobetaine/carnitine-CoA ligase
MGILYTSGTTGPSKGVRVTHAHAYGYSTVPDHIVAGDVALCDLPLFHIGGQWAMLYKAFIVGAASVVLPRFSAGAYWENVRTYGCTTTMMLGAVANFLYNQPRRPDDAEHPMRRAFIVPVIAQLADFQERFGITEVASGFGMTEASTIMSAPRGTVVPGRCGWPREDFEVQLVDEHDLEVPAGQVGELVVRAREPWSLMDGYHGMPAATVSAWRNQWLHTGDAMRRESDGQYVFVDRMKDAVRRRGENVSSFEVEKEINAHPAVLESAVVAVASDATEDEIRACVVLREGQAVSAEGLLAFLDERLPRFMVPRYVDFLDALPKTPTEKVQKKVLRDRGLSPTTYDRDGAK